MADVLKLRGGAALSSFRLEKIEAALAAQGFAARLYAEAFGQDAQFAKFYRSLEAYKASFANKSDVLVIDPASTEFFKPYRQGGSASAAN